MQEVRVLPLGLATNVACHPHPVEIGRKKKPHQTRRAEVNEVGLWGREVAHSLAAFDWLGGREENDFRFYVIFLYLAIRELDAHPCCHFPNRFHPISLIQFTCG